MKLVTQYNITSFKVKTQSAPTKSLAQILRNFDRLKIWASVLVIQLVANLQGYSNFLYNKKRLKFDILDPSEKK